MHRTTINLIKKDYEEINIEFYRKDEKIFLTNETDFSEFKAPLSPLNPKQIL